MKFDKRQTATALAAFRYFQRYVLHTDAQELDIASDCGAITPLTLIEIDALCEALNHDDTRAADALPDAVRRLLEVPEVRHVAANWASDELLRVRNLLHVLK